MSTEEQISQIKGVESLKQFYENNKKNINIAAIAGILMLAGVWYYYKQYKPSLEVEAAESLFMAQRYYSEDSLNLALNGDGINPGMIDIADEFGITKSGNIATFYAGRILLEQGKFQEALDYIEDASFDDEFMAAQIIALRGDCYSELGEYEKAGDYYLKAAHKRTNDLTTPISLRKAGEAYEEAGEFDDALDAYLELKEEYNTGDEGGEGTKIEAIIARLKAKQTAK